MMMMRWWCASWDGGQQGSTLLTLLIPLLHGDQGREVCLIIGQHQGRAVTAVGGHLQGQVQPSKRNGGKCWNETLQGQCFSPTVHNTRKGNMCIACCLHAAAVFASFNSNLNPHRIFASCKPVESEHSQLTYAVK